MNGCRRKGVKILYKSPVKSLRREGGGFLVRIGEKQSVSSENVLIAAGGKSYPLTGSDGDGYEFARSFGHNIIPPFPVLSPVFLLDNPFGTCSGISFPAVLQLFRKQKKAAEYRGDLLLTHKGLSGPVILNNSRNFSPGDSLKIQCFQEGGRKEFEEALLNAAAQNGKKGLKRFLTGENIPEKLAAVIIRKSGIKEDVSLSQLSKTGRKSLLENLFAFPAVIQAIGGFNIAIGNRRRY